MSGSDESINRVLAELCDADIPSGFELRVLRAVEERSPINQSKVRRWLLAAERLLSPRFVRGSVWLTGLASTVAATLLLTVVVHRPKPKRVEPNGAEQISTQATTPHKTPVPSSFVVASIQTSRRRHLQVTHRAFVAPAEESLALEEMRAPSLLAPPLPMTAQERALSRIGQRHRPDAVAVLNAELRAQQQAEATTEFYNFFEPAKPTKSNN